MRLEIFHQSTYDYASPLPFGLQQLRLTPASHAAQQVVEWKTAVEGATREVGFTDQHMNKVELYSFDEGAHRVHVTTGGVVETSDSGGVVPVRRELCPEWLYRRTTDLTQPGPRIRELVETVAGDDSDRIAQMHRLMAGISERVEYRGGTTDAKSTCEDVLEIGTGVCQDHAHVFISAARALGLPARYVSGYLMIDDRVDQLAGHAWAEVRIPDLGWVGFDVSNGISPDERYVRVATGLDYREAAPIAGIRYGEADEQLDVTLQVEQ